MKRERSDQDLGLYLDEVVYPALFERVDSAFPSFGWKRTGSGWEATTWPVDFPDPANEKRPSRLKVYSDRPWWIKVHGHAGVRFLDLVNNGRKPTGPEFPQAVRSLCELAGVPFPEREYSPEEAERIHKREARKSVLEEVTAYAQRTLFSPVGKDALSYLTKERGFTENEVRELGLGFYDSAAKVRKALEEAGADLKAAEDEALLWPKLEGYVLLPWADSMGHPLTLYGRWATKTPPEGRPKTIALPGEGTKGSPLYFDRARRAGHRDLVAVEGVFDSALLQVRGDSRVVAYVAAEFSGLQVETMTRHKVRSVVVCPDPDGGGDRGALSSVASLTKAGIEAYVTPRLPDGLDPDEFLLREGLEGWKAHVSAAVSGAVYRAKVSIGNGSHVSPDMDRRRVVDEVLGLVGELRGPRSSLDREDILRLVEEGTGYTFEALEELAEDHATRRRKEEAEKSLEALLREAQAAREKGEPVLEVTRTLTEGLASLQARTEGPPPAFSVDRIRQALAHKPAGKPSGWETLDKPEKKGGLGLRFNAGELSVLVGRPTHGKTSALVGLFVNWLRAAEKTKKDELLLFYSFEEPEEFLAAHIVSILTAEAGTGWTSNEVRDYSRDELSRGPEYAWPSSLVLENAWTRLRSWEERLQVVFCPGWTVDKLEAHARDLAQRRTVGAVLVDYWQKVPPPGGGSMTGEEDRRDIALAVVGRRLKALAVELSCPVVAGAQAGRQTAKDAKKIPSEKPYEDKAVQDALRSRRFTMEDIREGGIEQEVDLALGLLNFRADYKEGAETVGQIPHATRLEVGTLKNRYGTPGRWAGLAFDGRYRLLRDPLDRDEVK